MEELENEADASKVKRGRIILFCLLGLAIVSLILVSIFAPGAEFDYIFGAMPWIGVLIMAIVVIIFLIAKTYDESRESKSYLSPEGELDLISSRDYTAIRVNPVSKFLGKPYIFWPQKNLDEFKFSDGILYVRNSAGDEVQGKLEDLTYSYKCEKDKVTDEWYVYEYIITDNDGNKVKFKRHNTLFNEEEFLDMEMILALCGTVKESKMSKFAKKANSAMSFIDDPSGAAIDKTMDKIGRLAKNKLMGRISSNENSSFKTVMKKIKKYGLWILLGLYALAVIYVNVKPLFSRSNVGSGESSYVEEVCVEEVVDEPIDYDSSYFEEACVVEVVAEPFDYDSVYFEEVYAE